MSSSSIIQLSCRGSLLTTYNLSASQSVNSLPPMQPDKSMSLLCSQQTATHHTCPKFPPSNAVSTAVPFCCNWQVFDEVTW